MLRIRRAGVEDPPPSIRRVALFVLVPLGIILSAVAPGWPLGLVPIGEVAGILALLALGGAQRVSKRPARRHVPTSHPQNAQ